MAMPSIEFFKQIDDQLFGDAIKRDLIKQHAGIGQFPGLTNRPNSRPYPDDCYDARGLLIPHKAMLVPQRIAQTLQPLPSTRVRPEMELDTLRGRIIAALTERGWPSPELHETVDGREQTLVWGLPHYLIPWMRACLMVPYSSPLQVSLNYSSTKCGGSAHCAGDVSEIVEAIDCFRWVLDLPPRKTPLERAIRREEIMPSWNGHWARIQASHDIDPCADNCRRCGATREQFEDNLAPDICAGSHDLHEAWMRQFHEHTGGPRTGFVLTPRQADEAVGLVPLSQPEHPKRELAPFPARALR